MRNTLILAAFVAGANLALASDIHRYSGEGEGFDFVIETSGGTASVYLAKKPTNEPWTGAVPRLVPDDEKVQALTFEKTAAAGVFTAKIPGDLPEGQLEVSVDGKLEAIDAIAISGGSAEHDDHAGHEHGHGAQPRKSPLEMLKNGPTSGVAMAGLFFLGLVFGRIGRRGKRNKALEATTREAQAVANSNELKRKDDQVKKTVAILALTLVPVFGSPSDARANEGHSHGDVAIKGGAGATGEVQVTKKSQFLVGVRTVSATKAPVRETLVTFGHVAPKPDLDQSLRAPTAGFVRLNTKGLLGTTVRKGQTLARVEGLNTVDVRAPIDGVVMEVEAREGARVEAGEKLFRIIDARTVWVDAEVFQRDLAAVGKATEAKVRIDGTTVVASGKVLAVKTIVDEGSLTAKVFIELDNSAGEIPLGALSNVTFDMGSDGAPAIELPRDAVMNRGGERVVFVQTGPESFLAKPVVTRFGTSPASVVVTGGVNEGERVVVSGAYQLLVGAN